MRLRTTTIEHRHLCRRCMRCGQEQAARWTPERCAGCGCDFSDRPPRSYAELEGLVETSTAMGAERFAQWRETLVLERWLLTAFTGAIVAAFLAHALGSLAA